MNEDEIAKIEIRCQSGFGIGGSADHERIATRDITKLIAEVRRLQAQCKSERRAGMIEAAEIAYDMAKNSHSASISYYDLRRKIDTAAERLR